MLRRLGDALGRAGRPAEAEDSFQHALSVEASLSGADSSACARLVARIADTRAAQGDTDRARQLHHHAAELYGAEQASQRLVRFCSIPLARSRSMVCSLPRLLSSAAPCCAVAPTGRPID